MSALASAAATRVTSKDKGRVILSCLHLLGIIGLTAQMAFSVSMPSELGRHVVDDMTFLPNWCRIPSIVVQTRTSQMRPGMRFNVLRT